MGPASGSLLVPDVGRSAVREPYGPVQNGPYHTFAFGSKTDSQTMIPLQNGLFLFKSCHDNPADLQAFFFCFVIVKPILPGQSYDPFLTILKHRSYK